MIERKNMRTGRYKGGKCGVCNLHVVEDGAFWLSVTLANFFGVKYGLILTSLLASHVIIGSR